MRPTDFVFIGKSLKSNEPFVGGFVRELFCDARCLDGKIVNRNVDNKRDNSTKLQKRTQRSPTMGAAISMSFIKL